MLKLRGLGWLMAIVAMTLAAALPSQAQEIQGIQIRSQAEVIDQSGQQANNLEGKDNTAGVYVRDSAIALEKLALAQRMERLKEWGKSAEVYQGILEKYPD